MESEYKSKLVDTSEEDEEDNENDDDENENDNDNDEKMEITKNDIKSYKKTYLNK